MPGTVKGILNEFEEILFLFFCQFIVVDQWAYLT